MIRIGIKDGKLVNSETGESIGNKLVVSITGIKVIPVADGTECTVVSLKDRATDEDYFIIPDGYTTFSLRYAAQVLGSHGRRATDTPLILKVNNKGQMEFNFDLRLRLPQLQKISA